MTALNVSKAWDINLSKIYKYRHYDLEVRLNTAVAKEDTLEKIMAVPGIKVAEGWGYATTTVTLDVAYEINHTYPDKGHGSFIMLAPPPDSKLLSLPLQAGRWLNADDTYAVVLNQVARAQIPDAGVGDLISLSLNHRSHQWRIVGFVEDVGSPATAFVPSGAFEMVTDTPGVANMLRIAFDDRNPDAADAETIAIEQLLSRQHICVNQSIPVALLHNAMAEHMGVLVSSLLALSIMMGLVGALGLMSAMSMNVIERTREIGVLRAVGATLKKIGSLVVGEGLIAALISIPWACLPGLLLSYYLGRLIGEMAFRTPLALSISYGALAIWTFIIVAGSIVATIYPAIRAVRISTREALSYQ